MPAVNVCGQDTWKSWKIIGKAVMRVVKRDVVEVSGALQVCAGLEGAACDAAVHAMCDIFNQ